ncbi:MAG: DUF3798 domain-containing protein [Clostridia bacterium]
MKKLLSIVLALAMLLSMTVSAASAEEGKWKVAILTGTTTQGEEEFRAAEKLAAMYPEHVVTDTFPDNFSSEVETTIGKLLQFVADPDVKAIIFCQAVQGATAAFTQIKKDLGRDDILFIAGVPAEDPADISAAADILLHVNEPATGAQIPEIAKEWGVEVMVHYSFARHMSYESVVARYNIMKEECEDLGIELVTRDAPDPTGDAGMTGAQQFILEDVPLVMEEYAGKKVGFFTTNCGMQEALQAAVIAAGDNAFYPLPCCPSPFHGFPASLGLAVDPEEYGNVELYLEKAAKALDEKGAVNRMSTWGIPVNMAEILGGFEYAKRWIEAGADQTKKLDVDMLKECIAQAAGLDTIDLTNYEDSDGKSYDNYFLILMDNINFADYLK